MTAAVSFSWMLFVTLTPAPQRPYVDGSQHNSVFAQVFDYNGFGRVGQPSPNVEMGRTLDISFLAQPEPGPRWNRLLTGSYGRDAGWLLPASVLALVAGLIVRRRLPRTDPVRAGIVLWGTWLVVFGVAFTVSATINFVLPRGTGASGGRTARHRRRVGLGKTPRAIHPDGARRDGPGHGRVCGLAPA